MLEEPVLRKTYLSLLSYSWATWDPVTGSLVITPLGRSAMERADRAVAERERKRAAGRKGGP